MIRNLMLATTALLTLGGTTVAQPGGDAPAAQRAGALTPSPVEVGNRAASAYLARPDMMPLRNAVSHGVHYSDAASAYGALRLAAHTKDKGLLQRVIAREEMGRKVENTRTHVDVSIYGVFPLEIARQTGDREMRERGLAFADNQWKEIGEDGLTTQARYWIDDVWMIGALQVEAYRVSKDRKYLDRAALMADRYITRLQQPNGLFFHGTDAHHFWARGNGWVAAGLAEILTDLPRNHPNRPVILDGYRKMMAALLANQAEDGMWRQLIDNPQSWKETSATAMFAFAFVRGVKIGVLTDPAYKAAYLKAWPTLATYVQPDGNLTEVCIGTGKSMDPNYYLNRPRRTGDFHGQAALLWFASELAAG